MGFRPEGIANLTTTGNILPDLLFLCTAATIFLPGR